MSGPCSIKIQVSWYWYSTTIGFFIIFGHTNGFLVRGSMTARLRLAWHNNKIFRTYLNAKNVIFCTELWKNYFHLIWISTDRTELFSENKQFCHENYSKSLFKKCNGFGVKLQGWLTTGFEQNIESKYLKLVFDKEFNLQYASQALDSPFSMFILRTI